MEQALYLLIAAQTLVLSLRLILIVRQSRVLSQLEDLLPMTEAGAILQVILRQGWAAMAAFLVVIALLGGLAQVFKFTGGVLLGSGIWVSQAVAGILGVVVIALFGFLAIPVLAQSAFVAAEVGCGPVIEIGQFSALVIGGIGSLRMLKGVLQGWSVHRLEEAVGFRLR